MALKKKKQKNIFYFSPVWTEKLTRNRVKSGKAKFTSIGREKLCSCCDCYWPADTEFFHSQKTKVDGLCFWCKACYRSWQTNSKSDGSAKTVNNKDSVGSMEESPT
jgi:hypothetical protein